MRTLMAKVVTTCCGERPVTSLEASPPGLVVGRNRVRTKPPHPFRGKPGEDPVHSCPVERLERRRASVLARIAVIALCEAPKRPFLRTTRPRHVGACPAVRARARMRDHRSLKEIVPDCASGAILQEPRRGFPNELALPPRP